MDRRLASGLGTDALRPAIPLKTKFVGFAALPTPTFLEAIEPIHQDGGISDVLDYAHITYDLARDAKLYGDLRSDPVGIEGIAALMKWTSADTSPPFHKVLTQKCYNQDRRTIEPYAKFIWLLLKAMQSIEPFEEKIVFRGVKGAISEGYVEGREFTWHSPSSCTKSIKVLEDPLLCGRTGPRTIFTIQLSQGQAREIARYSMLPHEQEVLLPPGCRFKVVGVLSHQGDLTIVQLQEIPSRELILDLAATTGGVVPPPRPTPHAPGSTTARSVMLYHGTSEEKALQIRADGHLKPSEWGFYGPGIYLTSSRQKAEAWACLAALTEKTDPYTAGHDRNVYTTRLAIVTVKATFSLCQTMPEPSTVQLHHYIDFHGFMCLQLKGHPETWEEHTAWKKPFDAVFCPAPGDVQISPGRDDPDGPGHMMRRVVDPVLIRELVSGDEWVFRDEQQTAYVSDEVVESEWRGGIPLWIQDRCHCFFGRLRALRRDPGRD